MSSSDVERARADFRSKISIAPTKQKARSPKKHWSSRPRLSDGDIAARVENTLSVFGTFNKHHQAIVLFRVGGMKMTTIAARLGIKPKTVLVYIERAGLRCSGISREEYARVLSATKDAITKKYHEVTLQGLLAHIAEEKALKALAYKNLP